MPFLQRVFNYLQFPYHARNIQAAENNTEVWQGLQEVLLHIPRSSQTILM